MKILFDSMELTQVDTNRQWMLYRLCMNHLQQFHCLGHSNCRFPIEMQEHQQITIIRLDRDNEHKKMNVPQHIRFSVHMVRVQLQT